MPKLTPPVQQLRSPPLNSLQQSLRSSLYLRVFIYLCKTFLISPQLSLSLSCLGNPPWRHMTRFVKSTIIGSLTCRLANVCRRRRRSWATPTFQRWSGEEQTEQQKLGSRRGKSRWGWISRRRSRRTSVEVSSSTGKDGRWRIADTCAQVLRLLLLLLVEPIHQHKLDYLFLECFLRRKVAEATNQPGGPRVSQWWTISS